MKMPSIQTFHKFVIVSSEIGLKESRKDRGDIAAALGNSNAGEL